MTVDDVRQKAMASFKAKLDFDARLAGIDSAAGFDAAFQVDTSRPVELWEMEHVDDRTLRMNARYSPTPVQTIRQVIAACPVNFEEVSFVDFGCGKGRVLLVAADFPFRTVAGVDFSSALCHTARQNISKYSSATQRCHAFEVHCLNATEFGIPDDACVFYFYEPFTEPIAEQVLANIEASLARHPRTAVMCFVGTGLASVIEGRPHWDPIATVESADDRYYDAKVYINRL